MAESLEDFLGVSKKSDQIKVNGSLSCQEVWCEEKASEGLIDEDNRLLTFTCTKGHKSSVKI
jgi:hypothetical protein